MLKILWLCFYGHSVGLHALTNQVKSRNEDATIKAKYTFYCYYFILSVGMLLRDFKKEIINKENIGVETRIYDAHSSAVYL